MSPNERRITLKRIYSNYIDISSDSAVNITDKQRRYVENLLKEENKEISVDTLEEIKRGK